MAPLATWKGYVKVAELAFPVALYAGATAAKRVSFHVLNRKTGNRVHREYIAEETEKPVERDQQVKGYETGEGQYVILEPEEIAAAIISEEHTSELQSLMRISYAVLCLNKKTMQHLTSRQVTEYHQAT